MIQFYDERPADPLDAFVWFEDLFRKQFLTSSSGPSLEGMRKYVMRLLIAKAELWSEGEAAKKIMVGVIPYWDFWAYSEDEFEKKLRDRFGSNFNEEIFRRFEKDVFSLLEKLKRGRNI